MTRVRAYGRTSLMLIAVALAAACTRARPRTTPEPRSAEANASPCSGPDWMACDDSVEAARIRAAPPSVQRVGLTLRIGTDGRTELVDDTTEGDGYTRYRYHGYLAPLRSHVVEVRFYEGGNYQLIPISGGAGTVISAAPQPSPSGRRFATAVSDIESDYDPSGIEIWEMNGGTPV